MSEKQNTQTHMDSARSFVDLGLLLTQKVVSTKMKLKQINPTLIYQWDGETVNNQISGKGSFKVRNSHTNELVFECTVKKWINGVPDGKVKLRKINFFTNSELIDYKVKEIQIYQGDSHQLKKHGRGVFTLQQFFSSGKVKNVTIQGIWDSDVLIQGKLSDNNVTKQLNLEKNKAFAKSSKSIKLEKEQKSDRQMKSKIDNQHLYRQRPSNTIAGKKPQIKLLHPNPLKFS